MANPVIINTGGVSLVSSCHSLNAPDDPNIPSGGYNGGDIVGGTVDRFGVIKIFPDLPNPKYPAWYMDMVTKSNNDSNFNISYGTGSHIAYTLVSGSPSYYNSRGNVVKYASGNPDSRSVRADMYPSGGIWSNNTNYSYKSNPGYLYKANDFKNKEITAYVRPHTRLNTHETFAFKMQGRDQDDIRSCIEMVYATNTNHDIAVNVEYKHFPYVHYPKVKQYTSTSSTNIMTNNVWIGVKCVLITADDKKSAWLGMYEDITPISGSGTPNNHWKLRADCVFTGVSDSDYDNIIPVWDPHKDVVRLDGYDNFDLMWFSNRPISKQGLNNPAAVTTADGTQWSYGSAPSFDPNDFNGDAVE